MAYFEDLGPADRVDTREDLHGNVVQTTWRRSKEAQRHDNGETILHKHSTEILKRFHTGNAIDPAPCLLTTTKQELCALQNGYKILLKWKNGIRQSGENIPHPPPPGSESYQHYWEDIVHVDFLPPFVDAPHHAPEIGIPFADTVGKAHFSQDNQYPQLAPPLIKIPKKKKKQSSLHRHFSPAARNEPTAVPSSSSSSEPSFSEDDTDEDDALFVKVRHDDGSRNKRKDEKQKQKQKKNNNKDTKQKKTAASTHKRSHNRPGLANNVPLVLSSDEEDSGDESEDTSDEKRAHEDARAKAKSDRKAKESVKKAKGKGRARAGQGGSIECRLLLSASWNMSRDTMRKVLSLMI